MVKRAVRWLLQLDRPVPQASVAEVAEFTIRHFRRNFAANIADGFLFWLGLSLISSSTIVPLFISKLTTSTIPIGLAAMISQGGWYLPQLLTANGIERLPRKKPVVVNVGFLAERVPVWLLAVAALLAARWPGPALVLFLTAYAWRSLGGGAIGPAWQDMVARVIPVDRRGRFFGLSSAGGVGLGIVGSMLSAWLLTAHPFPTNFAIIFVLAAALITGGWLSLSFVREPAQAATLPVQSQRQFLASLPRLVRQDPPFRRFLMARVLLALAGMGMGFVTVSALKRWDVSDSTVGLYTAMLLLGQATGNLLFGLLADRYGHKQSLEWSALAYAAAFGVAWLAPSAAWYFPVFFLLGVAAGAVTVSGIMVVVEFCKPERRPTYCGIANTAVGLAYMGGPLLATALTGGGYGLLFALSAAIGLAAWVAMRWGVAEPRWAATTIEPPGDGQLGV